MKMSSQRLVLKQVHSYMNEVLIRLDEVVFSMSCVYEHIYRRVLIGLIFGQKQIQD